MNGVSTQVSTQATVTTTKTVKLEPALRKKLLTRLTAYQRLKVELDAIKKAMDVEKAALGTLRQKTGEQSLSLAGFKITEVRGVTSKLDKQKLVSLGCPMAWIEEATITTPKKPYELITLPNDEDEDA